MQRKKYHLKSNIHSIHHPPPKFNACAVQIGSAEYSALSSHFIETKRNNTMLAIKMQLSHSKSEKSERLIPKPPQSASYS